MKNLVIALLIALNVITCYFYSQEWSRNSDYVLRLENERDDCYMVLRGESYK